MIALFACLASVSFGQQSLVGVYKPGIEHGKLDKKGQELARQYKAAVSGGSMKLHKDKTFGLSFANQVMFGTWSVTGNVLTISVKEQVGKTKKQVAAMPESERIGRFKVAGKGKLVSLPEPKKGQPMLVWKLQAVPKKD